MNGIKWFDVLAITKSMAECEHRCCHHFVGMALSRFSLAPYSDGLGKSTPEPST